MGVCSVMKAFVLPWGWTEAFSNMKRRRFNWLVSDLIRKVRRRYLEWSARLRGQRFYCRALGGESEYNLTINCDLTVSWHLPGLRRLGAFGRPEQELVPGSVLRPRRPALREDLAKGNCPS